MKKYRKQSNDRKRNSSQGKKCRKSGCSSGKRRYSQLSFPSNYPQSHAPSGVLISSAFREARANDATRRFYASCDRKNDSKLNSLCEEPKGTCEGTKTQEGAKRKCTKGPAKCLPKECASDKPHTCSSTSEDKKPCETPPTCSREEYCSVRKGSNGREDQCKEQRESLIPPFRCAVSIFLRQSISRHTYIIPTSSFFPFPQRRSLRRNR